MPISDGWKNLTPMKKGETRNPNGRPKGKSLTQILEKLINKKIEVKDKKGKILKDKPMSLMNLKLIKRAIMGDLRAIEFIYDRIEGKVPQTLNNRNSNINYNYSVESMEDDDLEKEINQLKDKMD